MHSFVELIARKRDGLPLGSSEIRGIIEGFSSGAMADYQMSALLMAIYLRGLSEDETVALTFAMLHSGKVLSLPEVPGVKVDKHSTGGVGDKISICLAPLVAACGVPVPMVSGRGLGHTGGTLDKLEAIPGFQTSLSTEEFARLVKELGTCMIGQTKDIAPADKRIYALRDVTATVECIPLIVASILSKKLAEGIDGLVLDVKVGRGAFMKNVEAARNLATALVRVGTSAGKKVTAVLTRMDTPLGLTIGNANETREALEILHGKGPADVLACTMLLGKEMLMLGGVVANEAEATKKLEAAISSGRALETMARMVAAQKGDARVVADPSLLRMHSAEVSITATRDGFVTALDALELGLSGVAMGAGRNRAEDSVDHAVGIELHQKVGAQVRCGDTLAVLQLRKASDADKVKERVLAAFTIADEAVAEGPLALERIVSR
jgi:pyrimidine-nucleoside phosphorylase